jgi:1-acyl-sn-glycerol-3-phosphate acyltransferase
MADPKVDPSSGGSTPTNGARRRSGAGMLAAGVDRATGERAKRSRTPLLTDPAGGETAPRPAPSTVNGHGAIRAHRPRPVPTSPSAATATATATSVRGTRSRTRSGRPEGSAFTARTLSSSSAKVSPEASGRSAAKPPTAPATTAPASSGLEELVTIAIETLRGAAQASGFLGEDVERQVAGVLAFLRRRLTGDYTVDDFGFDEDFTEHVYLPLLRPLYKSWFRVEVRGIENIPSTGGALVVSNHSGAVALDALMAQVAVHDEHPAHRHLRMLAADLVFQTPLIGEVARKSGSTLAANPDAERLLAAGELAGVWPEGFKGVGKPFSERYKLQRFGRGGFVSAALRTGVPIVPCSIVGAEEIYPMLGNLKTVARLFGAPYVPITPTFPLLGVFGLIPLPSKWIIEFGAPVDTATLGPQAADDPMVVFDLTDQVRETIQQTLYALLMQRRSVFF